MWKPEKIKVFFLITLPIIGLFASSYVYALQVSYPDWFPIQEGMSLTEIVAVLFNTIRILVKRQS